KLISGVTEVRIRARLQARRRAPYQERVLGAASEQTTGNHRSTPPSSKRLFQNSCDPRAAHILLSLSHAATRARQRAATFLRQSIPIIAAKLASSSRACPTNKSATILARSPLSHRARANPIADVFPSPFRTESLFRNRADNECSSPCALHRAFQKPHPPLLRESDL